MNNDDLEVVPPLTWNQILIWDLKGCILSETGSLCSGPINTIQSENGQITICLDYLDRPEKERVSPYKYRVPQEVEPKEEDGFIKFAIPIKPKPEDPKKEMRIPISISLEQPK